MESVLFRVGKVSMINDELRSLPSTAERLLQSLGKGEFPRCPCICPINIFQRPARGRQMLQGGQTSQDALKPLGSTLNLQGHRKAGERRQAG